MLFLESDGNYINTLPKNPYYEKILQFKNDWDSGKDAFDLMTSGSTGTPKKVVIPRKLMIESVKMTQKAFELEEGDTAFCCLNVDYIAGMMMLVRAFEIGMDLVIVEPSANPLAAVKKHAYLLTGRRFKTFFAFVPMQLQTIFEETPQYAEILNAAKAIIVGGAKVNDFVMNQVQELYRPVYVTYGMTETLSHIAIKKINGVGKDDFFNTLNGVNIRLSEDNCLMIQAPSTNNEWIKTNDVVEIFNESSFEIHGRIDNVINSGGVKIQLEKIETVCADVLHQMELKYPFFAFSLPDETFGERLILVLEAPDLVSFSTESENLKIDIRNELKAVLPKMEVPKEVFFTNKFLETPTLKIDKIKTINAYVLPQISNSR